MKKILELLEKNSKITAEEIAVMLNMKVDKVQEIIDKLEKDNVILRYKTLINWEKTDKEFVSALIEVKVTPQRGEGFDKVAQRIYQYPEVKSVYLMSGGFDFIVLIEHKTMKEVAFFVAEKLAPIDSVISTYTHFVLKKYKDEGVIFEEKQKDERQVIS